MNHRAGRETIVGQLPQLFDAGRIHLRFLAVIETEPRNSLLGERAAWAFAENDDLCKQIGARLVVRFGFTVVVDALVAGAHADHAVAVPQEFLTRKFAEDLHAERFGLRRHPFRQTLQRRDVFAMVIERRRRERRLDFPALRQEPEFVATDRCVNGSTALEPIRHELVDCARVEHEPRNAVIADLGGFLDHEDLELAARFLCQLS